METKGEAVAVGTARSGGAPAVGGEDDKRDRGGVGVA